jgi:Zn-finger nucleic acid-binding protein
MDSESKSSCPRCSESLLVGSFHEVEIEKCPACQGIFVRQNKMIPLLEAMTSDLIGTIDPDHDVQPLPDKGSGVPCPCCGELMNHHGYMETNLVLIDSCSNCSGVWLDPDELAVMSQIYAKTSRRLSIQREASDRRLKEMDRRCDAIFNARRVRRILTRGFIGCFL